MSVNSKASQILAQQLEDGKEMSEASKSKHGQPQATKLKASLSYGVQSIVILPPFFSEMRLSNKLRISKELKAYSV